MKRLALIAPLALAACQQSRPVLVLPPLELTTCAERPVAPELPPREQQYERDTLTLDYVLALVEAHGDCRSKVEGLRVWREEAGSE